MAVQLCPKQVSECHLKCAEHHKCTSTCVHHPIFVIQYFYVFYSPASHGLRACKENKWNKHTYLRCMRKYMEEERNTVARPPAPAHPAHRRPGSRCRSAPAPAAWPPPALPALAQRRLHRRPAHRPPTPALKNPIYLRKYYPIFIR
jgi:hypothetical protein